jgi:hypothetical protein
MARAHRGPAFGVGAVLGRSFPIWLRNLVPFTILSAIVHSPFVLYTYVMVTGEPSSGAARAYELVSLLGRPLLGLIVAGAVAYGVFQQLSGKPAGLSHCLVIGLRRLPLIVAVGVTVGVIVFIAPFLLGVAVALGGGVGPILLLAIPVAILVIVLQCTFWVALPAAVVERPGVIASVRRSARLTKGARGRIFLILLVLGIISYAATRIAIAVGGEGTAQVWATQAADIVLGSLGATASAVAYHDLRVAKEGVTIDQLVSVFA